MKFLGWVRRTWGSSSGGTLGVVKRSLITVSESDVWRVGVGGRLVSVERRDRGVVEVLSRGLGDDRQVQDTEVSV